MKQLTFADNYYSCIYDSKTLIKYTKIDNIAITMYVVVSNGVITVEKYENEKLVETFNLAAIETYNSNQI